MNSQEFLDNSTPPKTKDWKGVVALCLGILTCVIHLIPLITIIIPILGANTIIPLAISVTGLILCKKTIPGKVRTAALVCNIIGLALTIIKIVSNILLFIANLILFVILLLFFAILFILTL